MSIDPARMQAAEPFVLSKARRLSRCRGFNRSDEEDIRQDLWMHVIQQAPRFDETVASWEKFVSFILDKRCISLLRHRRAEKRSKGREDCSLNEPVLDGDGRVVERHQTTPEASSTWQRLYDLSRDAAEFRKGLPTELHRQVMDVLGRGGTANSIAGELGIPRRTAERCVAELRELFGHSSLRDYM